jgi:hypothetical protein
LAQSDVQNQINSETRLSMAMAVADASLRRSHWTRHRGRRTGGVYTAWRTAILALSEETWSIAVIGATAAVPKSKNICPI